MSKSLHILACVILFYSLLAGEIFIFFLIALSYGVTLNVLSKKLSATEESPLCPRHYHCPVDGRISGVSPEINGEFSEVKIATPWWKRSGIYLPLDGEVTDIEPRPGKSVDVRVQGSRQNPVVLNIHKGFLGGMPKLRIIPGDRGQVTAPIGWAPWGGAIHVYLPQECEILVEEGNQVRVGKNPLAIFPEAS